MPPSFAKRRIALATIALTLAPWAAQAQPAEPWPSRPITLVVASGAGSGVDVAAREMAQKLAIALKQPVVVDNKPGASGILAGSTVAKAKADGYTLLYSNASFVAVAPALLKNMPYDPVKDLTPIAMTAAGGILLLVNKDVPANNLKELVALVKANPDRYTYGTWGNGSSGHLTTEWLKKKADLKMEHVPYKTTPQIITDLASGVLQIGWSDPGTPVSMIEANKIKGIAISGSNRVPRTRNVPTMGEQGYAFDSVGWFGMFGPAGLPKAITDRLNAEINKVQASAEMAKRMETMNFEPPPVKSAEEFRAIIAADVKMWGTIARDSNITGE
ncbi:MAG: tripartite tricarboxylate transporter substrate binding protein [Rhodoferax sp.]